MRQHAPPVQQTSRAHERFELRVAVSYSVFLLLCLVLVAALFFSYADKATGGFWDHQYAALERKIATFSSNLSSIENYTRQLLNNSTVVRFANMGGLEEKGFVYTAYEVMGKLADRQFALMHTPVSESFIYLPRSGYVISASQFTESESFYRSYRAMRAGAYDQWLTLLNSSDAQLTFHSAEPFTGSADSLILVQNLDALMNRSVPAVIWFEVSAARLASHYLPEGVPEAALLVLDASGERQFALSGQGGGNAPADAEATFAALAAMDDARFADAPYIDIGDMHVMRCADERGFLYLLALPDSMCAAVLGHYTLISVLIFLLALALGAALAIWLIRENIRPVRQLSSQLREATSANAELQDALDAQRPALHLSYMRKLISGHVASSEEFDFIGRELGYADGLVYFVLYVDFYHQSSRPDSEAGQEAFLAAMRRHLTGAHPLHDYLTLSGSAAVVLTAYDAGFPDPLGDIRARVTALHEELASEYGIWLYAGVGLPCGQLNQIWESYEQARNAARYAARQQVFFPYADIHKDVDVWYYPVEISAKLQHFITTANRQQVTELFALIYRENVEQRALSFAQLGFLLSDLRNSLLKARFQVARDLPPEQQAQLATLDQRLHEQPSFQSLEQCALDLCAFFSPSAEPSDPIPEIKRFIQENFTDPTICLSMLSERFNISESYLSHLFKQKTGENFSVFLESLRLSEAARRLSDPACNLSTLYQELGYNNSASFRRAFKKRYGMTPSEMR